MNLGELVQRLSDYDPNMEVEGEFESIPIFITDLSPDDEAAVLVIYFGESHP